MNSNTQLDVETEALPLRSVPTPEVKDQRNVPFFAVCVLSLIFFSFFLLLGHGGGSHRHVPPRQVKLPQNFCGLNATTGPNHFYAYNVTMDSGFLPYLPEDELDLLVAVHSLPEHFSQRHAIRTTWASKISLQETTLNIHVMFFIGTTDHEDVMMKLYQERSLSNDMVLVHLPHNRENATLQSIAMLVWVQRNFVGLKFLLKLDDDIYLNFPMLVSFLHTVDSNDPVIFGHVLSTHHNPMLKQYDPFYRLSSRFIQYEYFVSGSAYLVTSGALQDLCRCSVMSRIFPLEDAFITGLCSRSIGVRLVHQPQMEDKHLSIQSCIYIRRITIHYVTPESMQWVWKNRFIAKRLCGSQSKRRHHLGKISHTVQNELFLNFTKN